LRNGKAMISGGAMSIKKLQIQKKGKEQKRNKPSEENRQTGYVTTLPSYGD